MPDPGASATVDWPGVSVEVCVAELTREEGRGEVRVRWSLEGGEDVHAWAWTRANGHGLLRGTLKVWPFSGAAKARESSAVVIHGVESALSWKKLQDLSLLFIESAEEESWVQQLEEARRGLEFFQPYEEGQKTPDLCGQMAALSGPA